MRPVMQPAAVSKKRLWTGRIISAVPVLFLLVDGVMKLMNAAPVLEAQARLGYPPSLAPAIGILELVCLIVYVVPRTAVLGAILLTGYLGGATATHVRIGGDPFSVLFPGIIGALLWGGLYLRDRCLRALLPLRSEA